MSWLKLWNFPESLVPCWKLSLRAVRAFHRGCKVCVLRGCCFLQVLPQADTLRVKGVSLKSCSPQCKDADTIIFLQRYKSWNTKNPWAAGLKNQMSWLYKRPVAQDWPKKHVFTSPKTFLVEEMDFQLYLNGSPQGFCYALDFCSLQSWLKTTLMMYLKDSELMDSIPA